MRRLSNPVRRCATIAPPAARPGFEEQLGTRWAVWAGGLALALGGIFLIKYSIEQGYFGPLARVIMGGALRASTHRGGRMVPAARASAGPRRHPVGVHSRRTDRCRHVDGVCDGLRRLCALRPDRRLPRLSSCSASSPSSPCSRRRCTARPWRRSDSSARWSIRALFATGQPPSFELTVYLAFVVLAAYALARLRLWRWLAIAAAVGAIAWGFAFLPWGSRTAAAAMTHVIVQTLLAAVFLVADPHRGTPDAAARLDRFASLVLAGFAALAALTTDLIVDGGGRALFAGILVAASPRSRARLRAGGGRHRAGRGARGRDARLLAGDPPGAERNACRAAEPGQHAAAGCCLALHHASRSSAALAILATTLRRLQRGRDLPISLAGAYAIGRDGWPARHSGRRLLAHRQFREEPAVRGRRGGICPHLRFRGRHLPQGGRPNLVRHPHRPRRHRLVGHRRAGARPHLCPRQRHAHRRLRARRRSAPPGWHSTYASRCCATSSAPSASSFWAASSGTRLLPRKASSARRRSSTGCCGATACRR